MSIHEIDCLKKLREYLIFYKEEKGQRSLHRAIQNSKKLRDLIDHYCNEEDLNHSAKSELLIQNIDRPRCIVCQNKTNFERTERRFLECCSVKCAANNERRNQQIANTNIEKYGNKNFWGSKIHQEKICKLSKEKYGVDHYMMSDDFKKKSKMTSLIKYGTNKPIQSEEIKKKLRASLSKVDKKKRHDKAKSTWLKKYGVDHPSRCIEIFEKQQKNSFYFKDYIMPSGAVVRIQGYEDKAIDQLLCFYKEDEIIVSNSSIFKLLGSITYCENESTHRYFPDIYIPKDNLIIEVKSTRTYDVHKQKNKLKKEAVENLGIKFQFWIYGPNGLSII